MVSHGNLHLFTLFDIPAHTLLDRDGTMCYLLVEDTHRMLHNSSPTFRMPASQLTSKTEFQQFILLFYHVNCFFVTKKCGKNQWNLW